MDILDVKKALWGYQKESVITYVSELQLTYSKKLNEKEEQNNQLILENEQLKQENLRLQEMLEVLVTNFEMKQ